MRFQAVHLLPAALVASLLAYSSGLGAATKWHDVGVAQCVPEPFFDPTCDSDDVGLCGGTRDLTWGHLKGHTGGGMYVICQVPDTQAMRPGEITHVNVSGAAAGSDSNEVIKFKYCATFSDATGGACSATSSTFTGNFTRVSLATPANWWSGWQVIHSPFLSVFVGDTATLHKITYLNGSTLP